MGEIRSMKAYVTASIFDDEDREIHVGFNYWPASPGRREFGAPIEPDDPEEWEVDTATREDGVDVELTEEQIAEAIAAAEF